MFFGTVWNNGESTWGIRVGKKNLTHFDERQSHITLELDKDLHRIKLSRSFFRGNCPEIRGKAISNWYIKHNVGTHNKNQIKIAIETLEVKKKFKASIVPKGNS